MLQRLSDLCLAGLMKSTAAGHHFQPIKPNLLKIRAPRAPLADERHENDSLPLIPEQPGDAGSPAAGELSFCILPRQNFVEPVSTVMSRLPAVQMGHQIVVTFSIKILYLRI